MIAIVRRFGRFALLCVLLVLPLSTTVRAQEAGGVFEGQVINGTKGATTIVEGLPVLLSVNRGDIEASVAETITGTGGSFRLDGLETSPDLEYWLEVTYLDVPYRAGPFTFSGDELTQQITVTVYETTEDDGGIAVDSVHIIAQSFGQVLRITEIHLFGNSSDRTYNGSADGQPGAIFIPLPDGAVGLAFEEGTPEGRYVEMPGGIMDTNPVPPGSESSLAFFSYHLMVAGEVVDLTREFAYPVGSVSLLAAQPGLDIQSDQLEAMGPQVFQGQQYDLFVSGSLDAGQPLNIELLPGDPGVAAGGASGAPASGGVAGTSPRGNQELIRWLGFILAGLAIAGIVAYTAGARRPAPTAQHAPAFHKPEARRLLRELADLEDAHDAGSIADAEYERQRAEKHEALKAL